MLRYNKNQKYICFDFETCNLNLLSPDNKPWQLSYIIAEGNKVLKERDCYIYWPDLKLSEEARVITRFDDAKYSRLAKDPRAILEEFESYLYDEDYIIIGQNLLGFDVYIHGTYRKLLNIKPDFSYVGRIYDTNCIAKAIKKNAEFKNIGLRPGEKIHEELISESDSLNTLEGKNHFVILNFHSKNEIQNYKKKNNLKELKFKTKYSSDLNKSFLSISDLKQVLELNQFI